MNSLYLKKWFKKKESKTSRRDEHTLPFEVDEDPAVMKNDASIGKMAAFFAHEIRNPLTSIIGFSQHLGKNPTIKNDPNISVYISIIKEEAQRMEVLIQELLNLSKSNYHNDNLSIIDIKHCVEKIITIYSNQANENNIYFHTNLVDDVFINGNSDRFERVLINLIKNALEAIEKNGSIEIEMSKENDYLILSIIDSGPGIAEEELEQIFYPFFTTKDEGTGIGLPICKTIIETLGGIMAIQNHPTKGAHVKLKIPLSKQAS